MLTHSHTRSLSVPNKGAYPRAPFVRTHSDLLQTKPFAHTCLRTQISANSGRNTTSCVTAHRIFVAAVTSDVALLANENGLNSV